MANQYDYDVLYLGSGMALLMVRFHWLIQGLKWALLKKI